MKRSYSVWAMVGMLAAGVAGGARAAGAPWEFAVVVSIASFALSAVAVTVLGVVERALAKQYS